ncbi:hypothetical protein NEIMUCOT_03938 [Neisseria mucosa ATCC 25996]|uniref:Uncharacterized protein n=1 Tax=Neisseria mucosa (strain ATCC 25996 / DSM 4631 / NCTC 10774 / M26) TaxID=546266 RepID=D2ZTK2_NEIM2|nr:hypothetical protein NEIMUCOT_03938 [Neisseria mucosa ATCC 25996]
MHSNSYRIAQQALTPKTITSTSGKLTPPLGNARLSEIPRAARNTT